MGRDVHTMAGGWKDWDRITADDRVAYLPEPDGLERPFRDRSTARKQPSKSLGRCLYSGICRGGRPEGRYIRSRIEGSWSGRLVAVIPRLSFLF